MAVPNTTAQHAEELSRAEAPPLLQACEAALAWVDAMDADDGTEDLDGMYWAWVRCMRVAVAHAAGAGVGAVPALVVS